jgi:lysozyme
MRHWLGAVGLALGLAACGSSVEQAPPPTDQMAFTGASAPRFGDLDPTDWGGLGPRAYPVHGIDVARYQGDIDWRQVRASGVSFAFIKATEGGDVLDPKFKDNWRGARRAGVPRSAYHFFYFCRPAEEQARWFIQNVPRDRTALPHVLDLEWNPFSPSCTHRPPGHEVRAEADTFLDMLERYYGRRPIVYTTPDFYRHTGIGQLRDTEFWLRAVADHPRIVYPGADWTFWQYTGTGVVPGVDGPVDINVFEGSPAVWQAWAQ